MSEQSRDLRVALAMNGGVSLAVWIGGVASEFYRASRGEGLYGALEKLTKTNVVVDVLTGASAGGLNGAFLAAAISRELPGSTFDGLRDVWLSAGSFERLLRDPREKDPPSILRGDGFFLAQVEGVLRRWLANPAAPAPLGGVPDVELILTATTLEPVRSRATDAAGNRLVDPQYRARFTFTGNVLRTTNADVLARQLARAVRTSASFPGAFEPSYVHVGPGSSAGDVDMAGIASVDQSMWAIDGGVLVNKPIGPAFELIRRHRFSRDGKRLLLYVNPDPGTPIATQAAARAPIPPIAAVVRKALIDIPREESIAADLAEINDYDRRFGLRRKLRESLLLGVSIDGGTVHVPLEETANNLYVVWLRRDGIAMADQIVRDELARRTRTFDDATDPSNPKSGTWVQVADALRDARGGTKFLAGSLNEFAVQNGWRYGRRSVHYACHTVLDLTRRALDLLPDVDIDGLVGLQRQAVSGSSSDGAVGPEGRPAPFRPAAPDLRASILTARDTLFGVRERLESLAAWDNAYWAHAIPDVMPSAGPPAGGGPSPLRQWANNVMRAWPLPTGSTSPVPVPGANLVLPTDAPKQEVEDWLYAQMRIVVGTLTGSASDLWHAADAGRLWRGYNEDKPHQSPGILKRLLAAIVVGDPEQWTQSPVEPFDATTITRRLLHLFVLHDATEDVASDESRVEFVQLSADLPSPLDPARTAVDKVRGLDLGHFGGFVKTSWRANDWMWGCLDGSAQLAAVLLDPARLRQLYPTKQHFLDALRDALTGAGLSDVELSAVHKTALAATWTPTEIANRLGDEVDFLDPSPGTTTWDRVIPQRLPRTSALVALVLQQLVAARELPAVADAIERSRDEGAGLDVDAKQFCKQVAEARTADGRVPISEAERLLIACKVGSEQIKTEIGTDALTKVMANTGAVGAGALSGTSSGLGKLRHLFSGVRKVMSTLTILVDSALKGTTSAFAFTMALLVVGGGLVAARLLGAKIPTGPLVVGAALLAGFVTLVAIIVNWKRALASVGVLVALLLLASLDKADGRALCCGSTTPRWKPVLHNGGAIALALFGIVAAWLLHARVIAARKRQTDGDPAWVAQIEAQIAAIEQMTSLPIDKRVTAISDLRNRIARRKLDIELAVYDAQDVVENAVLGGLIAGFVWWLLFGLIREHTGLGFANAIKWLHDWRAVWLLTAFPTAAIIASARTRLWSKRS